MQAGRQSRLADAPEQYDGSPDLQIFTSTIA
jgi:hypothetical protein